MPPIFSTEIKAVSSNPVRAPYAIPGVAAAAASALTVAEAGSSAAVCVSGCCRGRLFGGCGRVRAPYAIRCEVVGGHQGHGLTREEECRGAGSSAAVDEKMARMSNTEKDCGALGIMSNKVAVCILGHWRCLILGILGVFVCAFLVYTSECSLPRKRHIWVNCCRACLVEAHLR